MTQLYYTLDIYSTEMKTNVYYKPCPNTLGGWGGRITRSRDRDYPAQPGETLSLLKIQKN